MEDKCIICGTVIPEGRQVCKACEKVSEEYDSLVGGFNSVYSRRNVWHDPDGPVLRERRLKGERE